MSKQTSYLLGILITIVSGAFLYHNYCCQNYCSEPKENTLITENDTVAFDTAFKLNASNFNYSCNDNFNFLNNNFETILPVDNCISIGADKLKFLFTKNPDGRLRITGYALNSEKNTSAFPNLGFARANAVKNYFVSKGIASNRFEINGELQNGLKTSNGIILGPVTFQITENQAEVKAENWEALKDKINLNPLILYFEINQSEIKLTNEERLKIADLSKYIDNMPNAKISCVGHTDGTGDRYVNIELGKERAEFAKKYLSKNGIPSDRIESSSKGPDEPIADNITPEGKAKNRRTVITLK